MSKRIIDHSAIPADANTVAWRSPGQLEDSPGFRNWLELEFPQGAAEMADGEDAEVSRRSFLKLMGASTALAGLAACRRPEAYIVPYTKSPEWVIPGRATYYATAMPRATGATPLVVTSFEGRPTKLAPNTLHPESAGTDAFAQASVLDLYSMSRSRFFLKSGAMAARKDFESALAALAADKTAKIGFVFGADDSPTRARMRKELAAKFSAAKFYQYEPLTGEAAAAVGDGVKLVADFAKADRILSLDCDFAGLDPQGPVTPFFDRRKPEGAGYNAKPDEKTLNRLYAVESAYSLTGGMADHRLRVSPSQVLIVAAQAARGIISNQEIVAKVPAPTDETQLKWIAEMVKDLKASAGKSVVLAGARQPAALHHLAFAMNLALGNIGPDKPLTAYQTETSGLGTLATLVSDIRGGAVEHLVLLTPANPVYDSLPELGFGEALAKLKSSIHFGLRTDATAHATTWHVPAAHYLESWSDTRSGRGVLTVQQPMILPLYPDAVSELELLAAFLSDKGALVSGEGPKGEPSPAFAAVRATFTALGGAGEAAWKNFLRDGFQAGTSYPVATPKTSPNAATDIAAAVRPEPSKDALEVVFATDASVYDGRWIDNGWLQEAPDPVSKLTWDNAALVAPKTAEALGIYDMIITPEPETTVLGVKGKYADVSPNGEGENRRAPVISVTVNGKVLEIAVLISFGQAENTLVIPLGYGQGYDADDELKRSTANAANVSLVGVNTGFNAYPLRNATSAYFASGGKVAPTGKTYAVALTQEHSAMYGRALAREVSTMDHTDINGGTENFETQLHKVRRQGNDAHAPPNLSLYMQKGSATWHPTKDGKAPDLISDPLHQWGMAIDLSSCMGCNACLVACQAENNIPIVGKQQVAKGREMHWIRMDRYYATQKEDPEAAKNGYKVDPDNPAFIPQPVACMQCELASCETVCPVNATVHTEDGLNAMAYNRCIGTRYCANNCPYKARRFNFFDYNKRNPLISHNLYKGPLGVKTVGESVHLQRNPNVTVRMRGIMEKCTFCVQRLKDAVIRQKRGQKAEVLASGKPSTEVQVTIATLRIPANSVKTACQEACPAAAISFGNKLDEGQSEMFRAQNVDRAYKLLNYIGIRPRTSYLARVKNPNKEMPDAPYIGRATIDMA